MSDFLQLKSTADRHGESRALSASHASPQAFSVDLNALVRQGDERFQWIKKNAYYYEDLRRFFTFHVEKGKRVLEIGFGTGRLLDACGPSKGMGLDLSEAVCEQARRRHAGHAFHVWTGQGRLPEEVIHAFPGGVDYILLVNAVGFWPDIQEALKLLQPICNRDTRILATYYNFLWAPLFRVAQALRLKMPQPEQNWLSADDVKNLMSLSGYRVLKQGYRCLLPKKLFGLADLVNRFFSPIPGLNRLGCTHFVIARAPFRHNPEELLVSVVIPARNERGNIEGAVRRMAIVARSRRERFEIIFVEGNSTDTTAAEIDRVIADPSIPKPFAVSVFKQTGKGKGDAVRLGFSKAKGDLLMILDADLTVTPEDLPKFIDVYCEGHGEFINGCRLVYKMEQEAMRIINLMGNKFFGVAFSWLLGQRFKDTLCGTKVVSRANYARIAAGRSYFGDFDPFGDFDLIFGASKLDLEIAEVPIRYRERVYGQTNISRWKHGWLLLKMCVYALGRIKFVP
ncbi:MAG: glycosyltransferase [Deltaproteobacteria bacterium]|nr:glycosyltransferase [Deltaproteobacteria bacterium]